MDDYAVEIFKSPYESHIQENYAVKDLAFPHLHTVCELLYCYDGRLEVRVGALFYEFLPGDLIVVPANTVHSVRSLHEDYCRYAVIQFSPSFLANRNNHNEHKCMIPFSADSTAMVKRIPAVAVNGSGVPLLIEKLIRNFDTPSFTRDLSEKEYLSALCIWILEKLGYCDEDAAITNSQALIKIEPALRYIEENYPRNISIAQLAELCNYSYAYFSKLFLRTLLVSPTVYINAVRITKSRDLLEKSDTPINDIACDVGFNDVSHFIRSFKKTVGISPLKYRNLSQKKNMTN